MVGFFSLFSSLVCGFEGFGFLLFFFFPFFFPLVKKLEH